MNGRTVSYPALLFVISLSFDIIRVEASGKLFCAFRPPDAPTNWGSTEAIGTFPESSLDFALTGVFPARQSQEALFANSVSNALNEAWSQCNQQHKWLQQDSALIDVVVSVPLQLQNSPSYHPFGDGQTNSHISFEWANRSPQLIATLSLIQGSSSRVKFALSPAVTQGRKSLQILYNSQGKVQGEIIGTKSFDPLKRSRSFDEASCRGSFASTSSCPPAAPSIPSGVQFSFLILYHIFSADLHVDPESNISVRSSVLDP